MFVVVSVLGFAVPFPTRRTLSGFMRTHKGGAAHSRTKGVTPQEVAHRMPIVRHPVSGRGLARSPHAFGKSSRSTGTLDQHHLLNHAETGQVGVESVLSKFRTPAEPLTDLLSVIPPVLLQ